jgi:ABC-type transport system involved in multi-copper enzyme maturation permease subunit
MLQVYKKNLQKSWISGVLPPLIVASFISLIALSWNSLQELILERLEQMNNPIYQAILGDLGLEGLGFTWQATLFMYAGGTINMLLLLIGIYPAKSLYQEIDKKSFDIILSFPVSNWRYLLEKFVVYLTYGLLLPFSMIFTSIGTSIFIGEEININLIINYSIGIYLQLFVLGTLSLVCLTIFLESNKALTASSILIITQYFLESLGGLIPALSKIQFRSVFHYFKIGSILEQGILPLNEVVVILVIGITSLFGALIIFEKREFAF